MDPPGWRQAENGGSAKQAIYVYPIPCLNFHDLNHYSQTNQSNNKSIMDYFNTIEVAVRYFKVLHQIMGTAPKPDQEKVLALAKIGATYDAKVQSWILSYAINYIRDRFLTPFGQKEMSSRFHQWAYIIRSFQGCDANFKADSFINNVLEKYLLSFGILDDLNAKKKLKEQEEDYDFSFNPRETIGRLQKIKLNPCMKIKKRFIEDRNCFWFLCLYRSNQEIYLGYENCSRLWYPGDEKLLEHPIDLLLMRREKKSIKIIASRLIMEEDETPSWLLRTKSFLKSYQGWKFTIPFEDEDMEKLIEGLNKSIRTRCFFPCEPGDKAKNRKRNRTASLT
ncbi:MAG: hypothetical protein ACOH2E_02490 [Candidatus Paracaedibacter sp.]